MYVRMHVCMYVSSWEFLILSTWQRGDLNEDLDLESLGGVAITYQLFAIAQQY